jgi:hypothetical protein
MASDKTSGAAASFSDIQSAMETFLTGHGWAAAAGPAAGGGYNAQRLWTKGDLVVRVAVETDGEAIHFMGATGVGGGTSTGDAPRAVKIASPIASPIAFPVNYEIIWNDGPEEVYLTISYGGNKYQHANFGESDVPDIGGTGMWITGQWVGDMDHNQAFNCNMFLYATKDTGGGADYGVYGYAGMYFGLFQLIYQTSIGSSFVHCALEGAAQWRNTQSAAAGFLTSPFNNRDLMNALPSQFNEAEVLLPVYAILQRTDSVYTPVVVLKHARVMRIDNTDAEEIITYGSDQWKCYPWYARNLVQRDGVSWATGAQHSGTFGVAYRYPA